MTHLATTHQTLDQATSGYNDLGTWDYSYDAGSNELAMAQAGSPGFLEASAGHSYDTADRLITTVNTDTQTWSAAAAENSWYTYDDLGNRISHVHRDADAIGYGHDKANRMTTLAGLSQGYDDAGNLTLAYSADRGTSYVYRYDHHNRLTGVFDDTGVTRKAAFGWDALGRRVEYADDVTGLTNRYYFDGVNELVEDNPAGTRQRYYVHGVSYVDERLMMYHDDHQRPYYYTIDRMYNVRAIVDRAGAIVERYAYDGYGRPYIRESAGRGDMDHSSELDSVDGERVKDARSGAIWDPRADLDDDGDADADDADLFDLKQPSWSTREAGPLATVSQAFSDVDNRYAFQGVPSFVMDTAANATAGKLILGHHRARITQPPEGRWNTRDPASYGLILSQSNMVYSEASNPLVGDQVHGRRILGPNEYLYLSLAPTRQLDPTGLHDCSGPCTHTDKNLTVNISSIERDGLLCGLVSDANITSQIANSVDDGNGVDSCPRGSPPIACLCRNFISTTVTQLTNTPNTTTIQFTGCTITVHWTMTGTITTKTGTCKQLWVCSKYFFCFPAETLVHTSQGPKAICRIDTCDRIISSNHSSDFKENKEGLKIDEIQEHEGYFEIYELRFNTECIRVTKGHFVQRLTGDWVRVEGLSEGDYLQTLNGPVFLLEVRSLGICGPMRVYNIDVNDAETYAVGSSGIIVRDW